MRVSVDDAVRRLLKGDVVAIPTDTVYGLAALMRFPEAVENIFRLKRRPSTNPLIILVPGVETVYPFVKELPQGFHELVQAFWPGALTLVVDVDVEKVPAIVRAGGGTTGFRHQGHVLTQRVLEKSGPVVAPSANLSGGPSATAPEHVEHDFGEGFPVLDGGVCDKGFESTVIAFKEGLWRLVRQGVVTGQQLHEVLGYHVEATVPVRGVLPKYVPKVKLHLGAGEYDGMVPHVLGFAGREYRNAKDVVVLGDVADEDGILRNFHGALRTLDAKGAHDAWVDMSFSCEGKLSLLRDWLRHINGDQSFYPRQVEG